MAGIVITQAELLEALAAAARGDGPDDARTVQEMADDSGLTVRRVREALATLHKAGRLVVHRVRRPDLTGRIQQLPGYTILPS